MSIPNVGDPAPDFTLVGSDSKVDYVQQNERGQVPSVDDLIGSLEALQSPA